MRRSLDLQQRFLQVLKYQLNVFLPGSWASTAFDHVAKTTPLTGHLGVSEAAQAPTLELVLYFDVSRATISKLYLLLFHDHMTHPLVILEVEDGLPRTKSQFDTKLTSTMYIMVKLL